MKHTIGSEAGSITVEPAMGLVCVSVKTALGVFCRNLPPSHAEALANALLLAVEELAGTPELPKGAL